MAMQKFKVLASQHYERNLNHRGSPHAPGAHVFYVKGDIVESERPLDEIYVNKFEKLVGEAPRVVTEARRTAVSEVLTQGVWAEEDRKFLEELSDADFARCQKTFKSPPPGDGKKVSSPLGDDVTDTFQRAYDEGFKVFRNAAGVHQVTRGDSTKPLNSKPLEAKEVDKFVDRYLKESK